MHSYICWMLQENIIHWANMLAQASMTAMNKLSKFWHLSYLSNTNLSFTIMFHLLLNKRIALNTTYKLFGAEVCVTEKWQVSKPWPKATYSASSRATLFIFKQRKHLARPGRKCSSLVSCSWLKLKTGWKALRTYKLVSE